MAEYLPLPFALSLGFLAFHPVVRDSPTVFLTVLVAAAVLVLWNVLLLLSGRTLRLEAGVRKQHYIQACAQGSVLVYWGWYWPRVYESLHLIVAQLLFAYAFDILLNWQRRGGY